MKIKFIMFTSLLFIILLSSCGEKKEDFRARLNYYNSRYQFRITFPENWLNYSTFETDEIIDPDLMIKSIYFALPTRSGEWQPVTLPTGYAALFSVRIFTPQQWNIFQERYSNNIREINNADRKIGEGRNTVFMIKNSTSIPVDLYLYMKDVAGITDTFRAVITQ